MINEGPRRLRDGKREMGSRSRKTERMPRERGMGFCFGHVTSQKEAPLYPHSKSWRKGKACDGFFVRCYHGHVNIWFLRKFKITPLTISSTQEVVADLLPQLGPCI